MAKYLFLIPLFPLIGAVFNALFGYSIHKKKGEKPIHWLAILMPVASFVVAVMVFVNLASQSGEHKLLTNHLFEMVNIEFVKINMAFAVDQLSAVMILIVTGVGSLIHIYAVGYMHGDESYWRFFSYLNIFLFAMLLLVMGDNLIVMFFGWEGVGFASYALIGFWYKDVNNASAGMKAFIVNRIGDFGFLVGFFLLFWGLSGAWTEVGHHYVMGEEHFTITFTELHKLFANEEFVNAFKAKTFMGVSLATLVPLLLFVGATGKSAQIPLYVWLPDAMAGPTPVSALIHAATMVTSGVYMISRLNFLFSISPWVMVVITGIGALTALFAASIALVQRDIKKVLAYSTVSQLGYMFIAVGTGAYWAGIFHVMTHAFFKALLFMGAGSVIMGMHHEQDMFYMGGLRKKMPKTHMTMLLATISIAGLPGLAGFFSKDEILWKAFATENQAISWWPYLVWGMGALAALFTSFYMFRLYFMTFSGENRADRIPVTTHHGDDEHHGHHEIKESPSSVTIPLMILAFLATFAGYIGMPHLFHALPNYLEHWLEPVFETSTEHIHLRHGLEHSLGLEWGLMTVSIVLAFVGFFVAKRFYNNNPLIEDDPNNIPAKLKKKFAMFHEILFQKYFVDELYFFFVVNNLLRLNNLLSWFDGKIIDGIVNNVALVVKIFTFFAGAIDKYIVDGMVKGVGNIVFTLNRRVAALQTGRIQTYVIGMSAGLVLIIIIRYILL